jgi:branched-chain amino acid aminotransferase
MSDFVAINGQITPYENARIAPFDAGFLHGAALFETMRAGAGGVFRWAEHLQRLQTSSTELGFDVNLDLRATADLVAELMQANGLSEARVRLTVSRGDTAPLEAESADPPRTVLISTGPLTRYPAALYAKGMTVAIAQPSQDTQRPTCGHKTTSYLDRLLVLRAAQRAGAGEALWFTATEKWLAEGCISNVFLVDNQNNVLTPPWPMPGANGRRLVLPGIARETVLALAQAEGLTVRQPTLTMADVLAAKEIFLTNVIMGVMPVVRVQRRPVGDEKPGTVTLRLRSKFEEAVTAACGGGTAEKDI